MKNIMSFVGSILGWTAIVCVFACIGFFTDSPGLMVPLYGIFMILLLSLFWFLVSRQKSKSYDQIKTSPHVPAFVSGFMGGISFFFPYLAMSFFRPGVFSAFPIYLITVLLIIIGFGGVWLINVLGTKNKLFVALGFLLLIILSLMPALLVAPKDSSYGTLGVVYFIMAMEAVIVWTAISYIIKNFGKYFNLIVKPT